MWRALRGTLHANQASTEKSLTFLLKDVRIIDVHPADDHVFPRSAFVDIIEAKKTELVVQDELGDHDETVTELHRISVSKGLVSLQNIGVIRKRRCREISDNCQRESDPCNKL